MIRNAIGSLLALIGAAAAVYSPFRPWYDGRLGRDFRLDALFQSAGITGAGAALFTGLFVLMLVAAVIAVLGVLARSRALVLVSGVLALGFTVLWMVRQGQAAGSLTAGGTGGLASGAWLGLGGGVLLLLAGAMMAGRRGVRHRAAAPSRTERDPDGDTLEQPYAGQPPPQQPYAGAPPPQQPYAGAPPSPPPAEPYPQPYPGQPGMRGAPPQQHYPGPQPPEPGAAPNEQPAPGPAAHQQPEPYGTRPHRQEPYATEPYQQEPYGTDPHAPEPYESRAGTQGAPLDEPYEPAPATTETGPQAEAERRAEAGPQAEGEMEAARTEEETEAGRGSDPMDNTRPFPTTPPPPGDRPGDENEDTWPHRGRDAA
ncbi:hypothetical protein [Streptomyces reniochalinae]|uniref:Uncharacterized protein n=1 Tax=Streptomyces reniochalinae TaxID=2250578 RepID=A0A367EL74_9ACTN|nr:hypothetical protein [Streptomyces reniochalinae]RCG17960.1 hypothetical protein DQ392_14805 [Streptomyces reniochalinae]